jgi:hypothetical protein
MGQAKRRKETDPNYGTTPPLEKSGYRGLIMSAPVEIEGTRMVVKSSQLDPQELRFSTLFWDKLLWPTGAIHMESGPDELFLESTGMLIRPEYEVHHHDLATGYAHGQWAVFIMRNKEEPGVWSLSQGERSFLWKGPPVPENRAIEPMYNNDAVIELHRAIPVPRHDVPLAEILEFRERRHDELLRLRYELESFVSSIQNAPDKQAALQKHIKDIDLACADLLSVGKEWQFPVYLSNIKATFNLSPVKFLPALAGGWKIGESYSLSAAAAVAGVAGLASTLEIKGDYGIRPLKRPVSPYLYAYQIHQELA